MVPRSISMHRADKVESKGPTAMRQRKSKAPAKTRMSADRTLDAAELGPKPRRKPSNDRAARGHIVGAVGSANPTVSRWGWQSLGMRPRNTEPSGQACSI